VVLGSRLEAGIQGFEDWTDHGVEVGNGLPKGSHAHNMPPVSPYVDSDTPGQPRR
jgi:hypothetical protein